MDQAAHIADTLPYYGRKVLLVDEHDTGDIVRAIKKAHKKHAREYDQICDMFWKGNAEDTARELFRFNKAHIIYDVEHPDNQSVKSPGAIIAQKHGDCKHYAALINGVADALHRRGKPISCRYRFVADGPDREVHHVFAVISDGKNDYWVDPVLSRFNDQPVFHNVKDVAMGQLYHISGTGMGALAPYPQGLPLVGKIKIKNPFKDLGKKLKADVQKAGKGIQTDVKNAGKEVKKIEHIALNVAAAPARNAFLALLDINAFNLATRMQGAFTAHNAQVKAEWDKLGGDWNKLVSAVNNGLKHKAYYHKTGPAAKVSGYIGDPVSITTLSALATAIIAVFEKYMSRDQGNHAAHAAAAKQGVNDLVMNASNAIDAQNDPNLKKHLYKGTKGQGNGIDVTVGTGPDGEPILAVNSFDHPQLTNAGTPPGAPANASDATDQDGEEPDAPSSAAANITALPAKITSDVGTDITTYVKNMWAEHKTEIMVGAGSLLAYKIASGTKKGKKIAPIFIVIGGGYIVYETAKK